ncbi:MAG: hypothetical protein EP216_00385 [Epsilonproteobacteria bacterium]|nr:MAG: hypothetical protein EP216_00385 [Campylobacterota bacterium]
MKYLFLIAVAILLNGCGSKVIASTHKQVLIEDSPPYDMEEDSQLAEKECQKYNKHAVYVPADLGDDLVGFSCVE